MTDRDDGDQPRSYVAIALLSCATLLLEITFTRVLSVVLWYHFAFLTVSLAMLGIGAPGVWFAVRPPGPKALRRSLLAAAVAIPAGLIAIVKGGALLPRIAGTVTDSLDIAPARVVLTVVCTLAPLLALGTTIVLLLIGATGRKFGRIYAADLVGAAVGALVAVPLMHVLPTPILIGACGFLPMLAAVILFRPIPRSFALTAVALAGLLVWGEPFHLHYTKLYAESGVVWEKWTPTARLTAFPTLFWKKSPEAAFGWGMGSRFVPFPLEQMWIEQDGSAGTPITRLDRPVAALTHLMFDVTSVGYQMRAPRSACVIGAGGGRDVLTALHAGAEEVDAVELNGAIIDVVRGRFREFSGDVYGLPGVRAHATEGRSFLTSSERRWDLIQISLIDSWAATAAGAFALSENNLYTVEAIRLYLQRLSPDGLVSISRWTRLATELEVPRLVLMVKRALELEGIAEPDAHIAVAEGQAIATVLVSIKPIGQDDISRLDAACEERGFLRHWPIGPSTPPSFITTTLLQGPGQYEKEGFDLRPPTDDRPFFFQLIPVFGHIDPQIKALLSPNDSSVVLLRWLMLLVGGATVALFLLPLIAWKTFPRGPGYWRGSLYFAAIGLGFMLVEAALIQRFILYLGHPSHATTVVLAATLVGAGFGSFAASKATSDIVNRGRFFLPGAVLLLLLVLPPLFTATLGWAFPLRVAASLVAIVPLAVLMGFAFPVGMMRFAEARKAWFWAVNGVTGVLAGIASLALAMTFGYGGVLGIGAAAYLAAAMLLPAAKGQGASAAS